MYSWEIINLLWENDAYISGKMNHTLWKNDAYIPGKINHIVLENESYMSENDAYMWKNNSYITSKELTIPYLLAANAVDKNPAWASQGTRPKTVENHALSARRPQGGISYRPHNPIINWKSMKNVVKQSISEILIVRSPPEPTTRAPSTCARKL